MVDITEKKTAELLWEDSAIREQSREYSWPITTELQRRKLEDPEAYQLDVHRWLMSRKRLEAAE